MSSITEATLRASMVRIGRELYSRGLVVATDGNLSVRLDDQHVLATPSGLCKGWLSDDELIVVDMQGHRVDEATSANRHLKPTSEMAMHLEAYRQRPDAQAIVHAHPPHAIALSMVDGGFDDCFLPEALLFVGIPYVADYATPSSREGAAAVRDAARTHDVIVLQRHGSLALASSLEEAYFRTESLEQLARIRHLVVQAGAEGTGVRPLTPAQAAKLLELRKDLGLSRAGDAGDFCKHCGVCTVQSDRSRDGDGDGQPSADEAHPRGAAGNHLGPDTLSPVDAEHIRELVAKVIAELV